MDWYWAESAPHRKTSVPIISLRNPFCYRRTGTPSARERYSNREDKTKRIWEKVEIYIVFHPSKMGNGRHWHRSWTTDRNQWIKHTWLYARQQTPVLVGGAACARSQTFSDVWEFDTKLQCTEYLNLCKQTISYVCIVFSLMYQH